MIKNIPITLMLVTNPVLSFVSTMEYYFVSIFAAWAARSKLICSERNALEMYEYISPSKWGVNFCLMAR